MTSTSRFLRWAATYRRWLEKLIRVSCLKRAQTSGETSGIRFSGMSGGLFISSAHVFPIDVWAKAFYKHLTAGLTLYRDGEFFPAGLAVSDISQMPNRSVATLCEVFPLGYRQAIEEGFKVHGRHDIHRLVLSSTPASEFTKR